MAIIHSLLISQTDVDSVAVWLRNQKDNGLILKLLEQPNMLKQRQLF